MILEIVHYGHPALRAKGQPVKDFDAVADLIENMYDTMYDAFGVGLAAHQVGIPLQLCLIDITEAHKRPSKMWLNGEEVVPEEHMPLCLINPVVKTTGKEVSGEEGCLSFPGISSRIPRPQHVSVTAFDEDGKEYSFEAEGLLARAVLHEYERLQGKLFIDLLDPEQQEKHSDDLQEFLEINGNIA